MGDEPKLDRGAIIRATAIICGGTIAFGFIIPVLFAVIGPNWDTRNVSGSGIFHATYWMLAWGLTIWQGAWMIREVHERIIDDMLVTAAAAMVILLLAKILIGLVYEATTQDGEYVIVSALDGGFAAFLIVVALIAARVNRDRDEG